MVWPLNEARPEPVVLGHDEEIVRQVLSQDGKRVVTTSIENVYVWDLGGKETKRRRFSPDFVSAVALSGDGKQLLTGWVQGLVRLWDLETHAPISAVLVQGGQVMDVALSPDERYATGISMHQDRGIQHATVMAWELDSGQEVLAPVTLANKRRVDGVGITGGYNSIPQVAFRSDLSGVVAVWDDVVSIVDLAPTMAGAGIPQEVGQLAESIVGQRLENGRLVPVPVSYIDLSAQGESLDRWASWLQAKPADRLLSPNSSLRIGEYTAYLLADGTDTSLRERLSLAPGDPSAVAALARSTADRKRAERLDQWSLQQLELGFVEGEDKATAYVELMRDRLALRTTSALEEALQFAGRAVDADPNGLEARHLAARTLNALAEKADSTAAITYAKLSALLFQILEPMGWKSERNVMDKGFQRGSEWRFLDDNSDPGKEWVATDYQVSDWKVGVSPFGFGDDREETAIESGPPKARTPAFYFRKEIVVDEIADFAYPEIRYVRDDGVVAYINGIEVFRGNMPRSDIAHETFASRSTNTDDETEWREATLSSEHFQAGRNVMAIELHQSDAASSDAHLDVEFIANTKPGLSLLQGAGDLVDSIMADASSLPDSLKKDLYDLFSPNDLSPDEGSDFYWLTRAVRHDALGEAEAAHGAISNVSKKASEQIGDAREALNRSLR